LRDTGSLLSVSVHSEREDVRMINRRESRYCILVQI
jgi:hypothetical protein